MKHMKVTIILLALVLALLIVLMACAEPAESSTAEAAVELPVVESTVADIENYGNLVLDIPGSALLAQGFAFGDIVNVTLNGKVYEMPVGSNFADVEQGSMICRVVLKEDPKEDYVVLAINMGDLATTAGIATKQTLETDPGFAWHVNEGVGEPVAVSIEMNQPGGYYDQWMIHQLSRSENREDYPNLTDAEFANFRAVEAGEIAEGRLYRSSSPVNPVLNRNAYADAAAEAAGVRTFVNLADNEETMRGYEGFADSYYSTQDVVALNLGVDFSADEFRTGLAEGMRFIANHDGPYLIHCTEGKDRAGFVAAILECLMGATEEEVVADSMVTFHNYYGVEPGTEQYDIVADSNIRKSLCAAFGLETLEGADLRGCAETYLAGIGLSPDEIERIRENLGKVSAKGDASE